MHLHELVITIKTMIFSAIGLLYTLDVLIAIVQKNKSISCESFFHLSCDYLLQFIT